MTSKWDGDVESISDGYTFTEMRFRSRPTSLSSEPPHMLMAYGYQRAMSELDTEPGMSPLHSPPTTPAASSFSHGVGAPPRSSTIVQTVLSPPAAAYRSSHGPQITYHPATPSESSFAHSVHAAPDNGPSGSSNMASQSEKVQLLREQRLANFHSDSGMRFKAGQTLPVDVQPPDVDPQQACSRPSPPPPPLSEASTSITSAAAGLMEWKQAQQRAKRVSFGGSAISEVPPMYTPN